MAPPRPAPPLLASLLALLLPLCALAGCGKPKELYVDHAWVRLPAVPRQPGAAYFTLHGGPKDQTLIDVSTDVAIRTEMHATTREADGTTHMGSLPRLAVPAHATVPFAPGGRHVMLFSINPGIKPGGQITLTFTFANGERILQPAPVVAAGDPAPKG